MDDDIQDFLRGIQNSKLDRSVLERALERAVQAIADDPNAIEAQREEARRFLAFVAARRK